MLLLLLLSKEEARIRLSSFYFLFSFLFFPSPSSSSDDDEEEKKLIKENIGWKKLIKFIRQIFSDSAVVLLLFIKLLAIEFLGRRVE